MARVYKWDNRPGGSFGGTTTVPGSGGAPYQVLQSPSPLGPGSTFRAARVGVSLEMHTFVGSAMLQPQWQITAWGNLIGDVVPQGSGGIPDPAQLGELRAVWSEKMVAQFQVITATDTTGWWQLQTYGMIETEGVRPDPSGGADTPAFRLGLRTGFPDVGEVPPAGYGWSLHYYCRTLWSVG